MTKLSNNHWILEDYVQRMPVCDWKKLLMQGQDRIIFYGRMRTLKAKNVGYGIVDVYKSKEE